MIEKDFVYSKIGMALVSAQRVEFIANQLLVHLVDFDETLYGISGEEFFRETQKANLARATLGNLFRLFKLNPKFSIENDFNDYVTKRNTLVHSFWKSHLAMYSHGQAEQAVRFCVDFGRCSEKLESFFKGFFSF